MKKYLLLVPLVAAAGCAQHEYRGSAYSDSGAGRSGYAYDATTASPKQRQLMEQYGQRTWVGAEQGNAGAGGISQDELSATGRENWRQDSTQSEASRVSVGGTASSETSRSVGASSSAAQASQSMSGNLSQDDRDFIREAMQGAQAEVQMGRLAVQNGQSQEVKQLGQRLVDDHTKANQQLAQLASQAGIAESNSDNKHQKHLDKLTKARGADFDREFRESAIKDHEKDIKKFEKVARESQNASLRNFAQQTLPVLREHLQMARSIPENAGGSTGGSFDSDQNQQDRGSSSDRQPDPSRWQQPQP